MKQIFSLLAAVSVLASCSTQYNEPSNTTTGSVSKRSIQFVIKGLSVEYGAGSADAVSLSPKRITNATITSEGMTDVWVFEDTTLLCHQVSTDADFGTPSVSLALGAHDLTFVVSKSDGQSFDTCWDCTKVKDTYGTTLAYTVSKSSTSKQVQLYRVNGKVQWTIEDAIPTTVNMMSISAPQCFGLDKDLNGVLTATYSVSDVDIASKQGKAGFAPFIMLLPSDHESGSSIVANIEFNNGVAYHTECTVVPNICTNIHGSFFSGTGGLEMVLNTDWGTQNDVYIH